MRRFLEAEAAFDSVEMVNLTCPEDRDAVQAGISLGQAFLGFGAANGVDVGKGELKDVEYHTTSETGDSARVEIAGRILYGPPLGSVDISSTGVLKREQGVWCVTNQRGDSQTLTSSAGGPGALAAGPPVVGKLAPDFALHDRNGQLVSLSSLRGKIVWVHFWASWCEPCKQELLLIQRFYDAKHDQGLEVLEINYREGAADAAAFFDGLSLTLPMFLDGDGKVYDEYRLQGLPDSFFIDRVGNVHALHLGALRQDEMQAQLAAAGLP